MTIKEFINFVKLNFNDNKSLEESNEDYWSIFPKLHPTKINETRQRGKMLPQFFYEDDYMDDEYPCPECDKDARHRAITEFTYNIWKGGFL